MSRKIVAMLLAAFLLAACSGPSNQTGLRTAPGQGRQATGNNFAVPGKIAFVKGGLIYQWSGGSIKQITPPGEAYQGPSWSPDGREIAASWMGQNQSDIVVLNADGKMVKQLTNDLSNVSIQDSAWARRPAWSPDGSQIAYVTDKGTYRFGLWLVDPNSGVARHANYQASGDGDVDSPSWSKDGKKLAFIAFWDGSSQLYVLDSSTGAIKKLTNDKDGVYDAGWSPDGVHIAYVKRSAGKNDVFAMDLNSGVETQLTTIGAARAPAWSPDGQMIAFAAEQGQGFDLYAIRVLTGQNGSLTGSEAKGLTSGQNLEAEAGLSWAK